jgi:TrmH family RNA methyltransferase
MAPRECAARLVRESDHGLAAVVFGPENSGLTNADLDRCNTLLTIPTEPGFSSLNVAMAVQVLTYEIRIAGMDEAPLPAEPESRSATGAELEDFYRHLEAVLTNSGFLDPENPRLLMRRLRRLFAKAEADHNEVNILRGILASLDPARAGDQDK